MCFKSVILECVTSPSFFLYSVNWPQLPTGIGQCFFVIMTELAMRRYIPGLSDRQSNKTIMVPFSNSFIEILNIHMPCVARGMQGMGGKMCGRCEVAYHRHIQNMTRKYHLRVKGCKKKVLIFYLLYQNMIKLCLKSYFIYFLLHRMNCLKKQRMRFLMK